MPHVPGSVIVAASVVALLAGCATAPAPSTPAATSVAAGAEGSAQLRPPVMLAPDQLAGHEVAISATTPLVLTVDSGALTAWTAVIADPAVAAFTPGRTQDGASYNPGIGALQEGTSKVTLTGPDGKTIDFTVTVVANAADTGLRG